MNQAAHHLVPVIDSILDTDTSEWDRRQNYNNTFFHLVLDDFMQLKPSPHSSVYIYRHSRTIKMSKESTWQRCACPMYHSLLHVSNTCFQLSFCSTSAAAAAASLLWKYRSDLHCCWCFALFSSTTTTTSSASTCRLCCHRSSIFLSLCTLTRLLQWVMRRWAKRENTLTCK